MNLQDTLFTERLKLDTRRHFLRCCSTGLGAIWLGEQNLQSAIADEADAESDQASSAGRAHHIPRAKRVIFLHMAGAPSTLELFDYKPELAKLDGKSCPQSLLDGKRFAFIQGTPKMLGPQYPFHQAGKSGAWISDRLPEMEQVIDEVCMVKSMHTDQFNHAPAQFMVHTGNQNLGYPSIGSWVTYGLGSENENLPGYMVLLSGGKGPSAGKSSWGAGFLPSVYQGVQCRSKGDPVLYLSNPEGIDRKLRRRTLDAIAQINKKTYQQIGDPETLTRIEQYEMAFRMQTSAAEAFDINAESKKTQELYGAQPGSESFANNCLLARRMAERGVRYIQLFDWGWDSHGVDKRNALNKGFSDLCKRIDKPIKALITDLKQRGLLDDTLIIWGGEFGRTPMLENRGGSATKWVGRDHNPGAFTYWLAGGGVKPGMTYGASDEIGYQVAEDPVSMHDLHATILHLLGIDHKRLTYPFQGVGQRLTNITKPSRVVKEILS